MERIDKLEKYKGQMDGLVEKGIPESIKKLMNIKKQILGLNLIITRAMVFWGHAPYLKYLIWLK